MCNIVTNQKITLIFLIIVSTFKLFGQEANRTYLYKNKVSGTYPILDDGQRKYFKGRNEFRINFKGFIDNKKVANEDLIVASDCCHINLVDRVTDLILD